MRPKRYMIYQNKKWGAIKSLPIFNNYYIVFYKLLNEKPVDTLKTNA